MNIGQEHAKSRSVEARKRWTAPELTRLEFPKTAAQGGHHHNIDFNVNYVQLS